MDPRPVIRILPRPLRIREGVAEVWAEVSPPVRGLDRVWFRYPHGGEPLGPPRGEPFVLACLFAAMEGGCDLAVEGPLSPSLAAHLERFQEVWHCWHPARYRPVRIRADAWVEPEYPAGRGVLAAFSGGLDSAYTVWRHRPGAPPRAGIPPLGGAALMLLLGREDEPPRQFLDSPLVARLSPMVAALSVPLTPIRTNVWYVCPHWEDGHGAAVAAGLHILAGQYHTALLAASVPYHRLFIPWGSNPITDPWMAGDGFRIHHDGADVSRLGKARAVADWPEALDRLLVCYRDPSGYQNCSRCEKCIRTILSFRMLGIPLPPAFDHDPTLRDIAGMRMKTPLAVQFLAWLLEDARETGANTPWLAAARLALWRNRRRHRRRPSSPG
jgi:hypothetical protein